MNLKLVDAQCYNTNKHKLRVGHVILVFAIICIPLVILMVRKINLKTYETAVLSTTDVQNEQQAQLENENTKVLLKNENNSEDNKIIEVSKAEPKLPVLTNNAKEKIKHIYSSDEKVAYLTFDDGPSNTVTPFILDLLKENNIKVTFFTLGKNVEYYPEIVKREYDEGHYIANHGYSHVYKNIYASVDNVLDEFNRTETAIQNALSNTEYHSHLIRFPGGSKGNKYESLIAESAKVLEEQSVAYIDWNCLTGDSAGNKDKESLMNELISTSQRKKQFSHLNA